MQPDHAGPPAASVCLWGSLSRHGLGSATGISNSKCWVPQALKQQAQRYSVQDAQVCRRQSTIESLAALSRLHLLVGPLANMDLLAAAKEIGSDSSLSQDGNI